MPALLRLELGRQRQQPGLAVRRAEQLGPDRQAAGHEAGRHVDPALGSLTYHFPSQTELLRESLLLHVRDEVERLTAIAAELRRSAHSVAEIAAAVESIVGRRSNRIDQLAELELHLHAARDRELQDASRRCFAAYEDFAAAALGALSVPEPTKHARAVVALMTGLALRRLGTGRHDAAGTADALMTIVNGAMSLDSRD